MRCPRCHSGIYITTSEGRSIIYLNTLKEGELVDVVECACTRTEYKNGHRKIINKKGWAKK